MKDRLVEPAGSQADPRLSEFESDVERRELASGLGTNRVVLEGGLRRLFLRETASTTLARIQSSVRTAPMYLHSLVGKTHMYHMPTGKHEKIC